MPSQKALAEISKYNSKIEQLESSYQYWVNQMQSCKDYKTSQAMRKNINKTHDQLAKTKEKLNKLINFGISTREQNQFVEEVLFPRSNYTTLVADKTLGGFNTSYIGFSQMFQSYVKAHIASYSSSLRSIRGYKSLAGKKNLTQFQLLSQEEYNVLLEENNKVVQEAELKKLEEMKKKMSSYRAYQLGDQHKYYGSTSTYECKPGLFVYSGFGTGAYYSSDFNVYSCSRSEAAEMSKLEKVDYKGIDSFDYYRATYVGD